MDLKDYLKDLLTIEYDIQTKLQQLSAVKSYNNLDQKSNEIKKSLKEYKEKLNEMKDFCNLIQTTNNSNNTLDLYLKEVKIQTDHFSKIETKFRNEYFSAQKKLETFERDSLLTTSENADQLDDEKGTTRQRKNIDKDMFYNQTKVLNENLSDLNRTMKSSLEQSNKTLHRLETSSNSLRSVHDEFSQMSSNINDSKKLLTKYDQREFTNKLLVFFALIFFFAVVVYIIWKRLF